MVLTQFVAVGAPISRKRMGSVYRCTMGWYRRTSRIGIFLVGGSSRNETTMADVVDPCRRSRRRCRVSTVATLPCTHTNTTT